MVCVVRPLVVLAAFLAMSSCSSETADAGATTTAQAAADRAAWSVTEGSEDLAPAVCKRGRAAEFTCLVELNSDADTGYRVQVETFESDGGQVRAVAGEAERVTVGREH